MSLIQRLHNHVAQMAPHQKNKEQGKLLIESLDVIKSLRSELMNLIRFGDDESQRLNAQIVLWKMEYEESREK
jgi:hypothetical protein